MKNRIIGVITYIICGDNVLLIYKKKGHGKGFYNGPGGKVAEGETPLEAAIRETKEETGVVPENLKLCGFIRFYDVLDDDWEVYVYRSHSFIGKISESDEAKPQWFKKDKLPYALMWEDDKYWLPIVIEGGYFYAQFWFKGLTMKRKKVDVLTEEEFYKKVKDIP